MKYGLKEKLNELGYAFSYIDEKLSEWVGFDVNEEKGWNKYDDNIVIEKWQQPTEEVPKFFLNIDDLFEDVFVFDGDIHSIYKENVLNDKIQFADYLTGNKLCLIRIA